MKGTTDLGVRHGQYHVGDSGGDLPMPAIDDGTKIIFPAAADIGGALIAPGTFWGPVEVTVETLDARPLVNSSDADWEQTQEVELVALGDEIQVYEPDGEGEGLPRFPVEPGQSYRLRVSVRGRRAGKELGDEVPQEPVEYHLIQMWAD